MSSRKRKKVEYRPTEGDPRNTQASFRLQDFIMWKFCTFSEFAFYVLLLLALTPAVNSNETPTPRQCAVCLDKDCANGVRRIYPAGSNTAVWVKAISQTGIQNCSMENLKPDAPCKMANGNLAQLADNPLYFEGIDTYDVRRVFNSQISPCADLYLPPSSTPSPVTKAPNIPVADNKDIIIGIIIGSVIGIVGIIIIIIIGIGIVCIRGFIWKGNKLSNYQRGQDRDHRHGNNGVPPHDAVHRDEITNQMQPLNADVANGKLNKVQ